MLYGKLKSCSLFHDLDEKEINCLCEKALVREYDKEQVISKIGDPIEDFSILIHGKAELFIKGEDTAPVKVQSLNKYDFFGEVIFSNENHHFYSVRVFEDTSIVFFNYEAFQYLYEKMPKGFATFLLNLLRYEYDRFRVGLGILGRVQDESDFPLRLPLFGQTKRKVFLKPKRITG